MISCAAARALVGEGRRHADVDHREVRPFPFDGGEEIAGVPNGGDHLVTAIPEQPREAIAQQRLVFGDHETHGNSIVRLVPRPF